MVAPAITRNPVELRGCCWLAALLSVVSGALRQLERGDYRGDAAADHDDVGYLNAFRCVASGRLLLHLLLRNHRL